MTHLFDDSLDRATALPNADFVVYNLSIHFVNQR